MGLIIPPIVDYYPLLSSARHAKGLNQARALIGQARAIRHRQRMEGYRKHLENLAAKTGPEVSGELVIMPHNAPARQLEWDQVA